MEIELKLSLQPAHAGRLGRHPLLAGIKPQRAALHSLYFDTPDFELTRRLVALRLRRLGYHWVQTLKVAAPAVGALSRRPEWEAPLADRTPDLAVLPPEARAELHGIDLSRLAPVFVTEVKRTTWVVELAETRMEIALDQGEIQAGDAVRPLSEIELELLSGPATGLFDAALALLERIPCSIDSRSKAALGYQLAGAVEAQPVKAGWPVLDPLEPAGLAWTRLVEAGLAQLVDNLPGFLEQPEELEYLHQIRVALRRILGLARLLGDRPAWISPLRELMDVLNPARDWDVFQLETLPRLPVREEAGLLEQVVRAAAEARSAAQARLASADFTQVLLRMGRALHEPPELALDTGTWAARVLDQRWKGVKKRSASLTTGNAEERHGLRIALKRMRYAGDALAGLYGKRGQRTLAQLEALQDSLGDLNDLAVAERLLRQLAVSQPDAAFSAGRMVGLLQAAPSRGESRQRLARRLAEIKPFWRR
jgi:inorganic triphosphatase YgiF